jgi:Zn-dependent peptidase ImmA (M78 family)/transcriptional regulator with XRE-family HTH domain
MIYGERIEQAREFHGLTQKEFAERLGCDQSMVARMEAGVQPSSELASTVASETGFPPEWFAQEPTAHFPMGSLQFRARADMSAKQRRQSYQHARTSYELVEHLSPRAKLLPVRLPRLSERDPKEAAATVRSECGLSPETPIGNVFNAVERAGAIAIALPTSLQKRDGFSGWAGVSERRPIINIPSGAPGDRMRWTTAHEVGELVLGSLPPGPEREKAADQFAAAFLMPEHAMKRELKAPVSLTTLAYLKPRWGVAMSSLAKRAKELDIISDRQYRYLMQQMGMRHWRTDEPVKLAPEKPRALRKLVEILYGDPIDYRRLSADVHLSSLYLRELIRLHAGKSDLSGRPTKEPHTETNIIPIRARITSVDNEKGEQA